LRIPWYLRRLSEIAQDEGVVEAGLTLFREVMGTARYRLYRALNDNREYRRVVQGSKMYLPITDMGISQDLSVRGIREREETRLIQHILHSGMTVIDIGANIGYYALIEAHAVGPGGRVYAIEPEPRNYSLLARNVALNRYDYVSTFQIGISDETGFAKLHVSQYSNLHNLVSPIKQDRNLPTIDVQLRRLDAFIQEEGIKPAFVDLVRMDIEGWEAKALLGMQDLLRASPHLKLFIEFHPWAIARIPGHSIEQTLGVLEKHGFLMRYVTGRARNNIRFQLRNLSITDFLGQRNLWEDKLFRALLSKDTVRLPTD